MEKEEKSFHQSSNSPKAYVKYIYMLIMFACSTLLPYLTGHTDDIWTRVYWITGMFIGAALIWLYIKYVSKKDYQANKKLLISVFELFVICAIMDIIFNILHIGWYKN